MKIKIGKITEEILRMSNDLYKTSTQNERLSIQLKNTNRSVSEIDELITVNYSGTIILVDDGKEETFEGYKFESVRKAYDSSNKQLTIEFIKQEEELSEA